MMHRFLGTCSTRMRYWPLGKLLGRVNVKDVWAIRAGSMSILLHRLLPSATHFGKVLSVV